MIKGCKPDADPKDHRILFELTGRRLRVGDFPAEDETSEEFDAGVLLENILGFDDMDEEENDELMEQRSSLLLLNNSTKTMPESVLQDR